MYDERTRYIQAYLGHLASVEKEKKDAGWKEKHTESNMERK